MAYNVKLEKARKVATFPLTHRFTIYLNITIESDEKRNHKQDYSIFHITRGGDYGAFGERYPALWYRPALGLCVYFDYKFDQRNQMNCFNTVEENQPTTLRIRMYPKEDGTYFWTYEICINDESCQPTEINRHPHPDGVYPYEYGDSWTDVQLYLSSPWYPPLEAAIIHSFGVNIGNNHFTFVNFYSSETLFYRPICNSVPTETRILQGHQLCWH